MKTTADANNTGVLFTQARMLISQAYKKMDKVDSRKQRGKIKKEYLVKIDQLLKSSLGPLPRRIKIDEKGAQGQGISYSPKQYMTQHLKLTEADFDYVTLLHDPNLGRNPRNWYRKTTWKDGYAWPAVEMINVPMKVMQQATISTLRQGEAVWFAINGSLSSNPYAVDDGTAKIHKGKGQGVICEKAFDYGLFGPKVRLSKRDRRACHHLDENHAMAIIGYDMGKPRKSSDGKRHRRTEPLKWLVENSWGQAGDHGLLHLYRDAYKNEVINVVVPRSILPAYVLEKAASKPAIEINR